MVESCCIYGCKEKSSKDRKFSFHYFPKDEERRKLWLSKVKMKHLRLVHNAKICSKHFTPESFDREKLGGTWLKKTAVPTLFLTPDPPQLVKETYLPPKEEIVPKIIKIEDPKEPPSEPKPLSKKTQYFIGKFQNVDTTSPVTKALNACDTCNENGRGKIKDFRTYFQQVIWKKMESKTLVVQPAIDIFEVCELHFEQNQIVREASAFDPRTGRTLTAPLSVPRLQKGAIPTLFMPPALAKSKSHPKGLVASRRKKDGKMKEETKEKDGSEPAKLLPIGTESKTVDELNVVIKQEPVDPADEPNPPVIGNVQTGKDLASSSRSSPLVNPPPLPAAPPPDPDSTNKDEAETTRQPDQKSKTNDWKPKAKNTATPITNLSSLLGNPKRSSPLKRASSSHLNEGASKKPAKFTILQNKSVEETTREMFQHLVNDSEDSPLFGSSRTGEKNGDLFNVFGDFIADKLREMSFDNCAFSLRAILEIVFKASRVQPDSEEDSDESDPCSAPASPCQE